MKQPATIFCEDAPITAHTAYPGEQWILRVQAPKCAAVAQPGQFAHITCNPALPMRRPISIMRCNPRHGWVEFLYKVVGLGTQALSRRGVGERISLLAPIGQPFSVDANTQQHLLLGGGVGMPPMLHLAEQLKQQKKAQHTQVLLGSEVPFPFRPQPSKFIHPPWPDGVIAAMPLLEDWGVDSRLASLQDFPGCFQGYITDLAEHWLQLTATQQRQHIVMYACGPNLMLRAVAALSAKYAVHAQLCLEEYMACGVGGCAGCVVKVSEHGATTMQRVCVDGPVFTAHAIYPELFPQ